jgi:hypothetical protein
VIKKSSTKRDRWDLALKRMLRLLGHRNWVVVADSAYPAQSNAGIETIVMEADHLQLLRSTLNAIGRTKHVRANLYLDSELDFVSEDDAPGVSGYREDLAQLIGNQETQVIAHDRIIEKLDESARFFRILILKSTLTIPYTSVFFELDCGYWSRDAEQRLRLSIAGQRSAGTSTGQTENNKSRKRRRKNQ